MFPWMTRSAECFLYYIYLVEVPQWFYLYASSIHPTMSYNIMCASEFNIPYFHVMLALSGI